MCDHTPECPAIDQPGWDTAAMLVHHEDLGWRMLCNGAIVMDAAVQPVVPPVVTPVPAATPLPARPVRARTRTRKAAPARKRTAQPIAA
ncbi:DUF5999 family protein [Actinoplanes sp. Pm04-4]|uniref:DUF5999 family protein n=1 Tax=Paractinoplanes pyxinae TaxID=2997416 RepID=A0ABT4B9D2_9ACTN|nr:DUF5999 family protein [Actinoplanes pyxinae]MCY1143123.1 DUF5999 family protein [Actinoplanes pyxinae]